MLVTELSYPKYRAPLTSTYNSLWYSGAIMLVSFTSPAYRTVSDGLAQRCLGHLRNLQDQLDVGMACPFFATGAPLCPPSHLRLVRPRIAPFPGQQGQRGRGSEDPRVLPCRRQ